MASRNLCRILVIGGNGAKVVGRMEKLSRSQIRGHIIGGTQVADQSLGKGCCHMASRGRSRRGLRRESRRSGRGGSRRQ